MTKPTIEERKSRVLGLLGASNRQEAETLRLILRRRADRAAAELARVEAVLRRLESEYLKVALVVEEHDALDRLGRLEAAGEADAPTLEELPPAPAAG